METRNPVIVAIAYNRTHSLNRLLSSLRRAVVPKNTRLVISIDNNGKNEDVVGIARQFNWSHGPKDVIYHNTRLGLRNHIIKCGDLSEEYGSVIILEDDLYVSPYFYDFALAAQDYYGGDENIAGISLYNQPYTESVKLPFAPLRDNSDVYFLQIASSYGQLWTYQHWKPFKEWYDTDPDLMDIDGLPMLIKLWPPTSWKKYFCAYMVEFNKYFVFPQLSYTTNFSDPGSNFLYRNHFGQTQIDILNHKLLFKPFHEALNVYDAYSEILPEKLKSLAPELLGMDLEVDLYGKKEKLNSEFVITSKPTKAQVESYERSMKPHELNVILGIPGNDLHLSRVKDVLFFPRTPDDLLLMNNMEAFIEEYGYFYRNIYRSKILLKIVSHRFNTRVKGLFRRRG